MSKEYNASNIRVLDGLEAVRQRPAMYIGDTGSRGMHHLVFEAIDNGVDEAMAGYCTKITVGIHSDNSVTITDDGRGIPVDTHEKEGKSALEVVLTTLHAGGKFDREGYAVSGGLHGVGISCANALSEWFEAEIRRDGHRWFQKYERGEPQCEVKQLGETKRRGTQISFLPDVEIFGDKQFQYDIFASRLRELAFLTPGVHFGLYDERTEPKREDEFYAEDGLASFVRHLNEGRTALTKDVCQFDGTQSEVGVEVALQYHDGFTEGLFGFANNIRTPSGGTHVSGFKSALTRVINAIAKRDGLLKDKVAPTGDDVREGLTAVISVKLGNPQFEGQTKAKLGNPEVDSIAESVCYEKLTTYFDSKPNIAKTIIQKASQAATAREAARKARDLARRKGALSSGNLPGKLFDCQSKTIEDTELFLVEGISAGGSAVSGRDRKFQAILPLQGKILNVEKARIDRVLAHRDISTVIAALGTNVSTDYSPESLRYGKVIIMTDADVDGSHIRTLLLTFFFREMPELIEAGRLYMAQPPLYRVKRKKKEDYVTTEEELHSTLLQLGLDSGTLSIEASADAKNKKAEISGEELKELVKILGRIEKSLNALVRKGIDADNYLTLERKGAFPLYRVTEGTQETYFYTEDELGEFLSKRPEVEATETEDEEGRDVQAPIIQQEVFESRELTKYFELLKKWKLSIKEFISSDDEREIGDETPPPYRYTTDNTECTMWSISELLANTREAGRKGLDIQRYKGLGEMNPEQLWNTTMDPTQRTLRRVLTEDAVAADQMFSLLMGEEVLPRRQFIERHALEISNLDV